MQQVEKGVFVRGVLVWCVCCVCVCCVGFGLCCARARASHLAHPLTHVGTVDDGRPQYVKSPPPLCFVLSVGFVVCGVVFGGGWWCVCGCCAVVVVLYRRSRVVCAYMCWCAGWSGV